MALEGLNRSGKGTQLALLDDYLRSCGIPTVTLRGDGSREGRGETEGDPWSEWWQQFRQRERACGDEAARFACWNEAANVLAAELLEWRHGRLPEMVERCQAPYGVLLLDRSLLSRLMLVADANPSFKLADLYAGEWKEHPLTWELVCPDLMVLLRVDQATLLERLDLKDPKYQFRRRLIGEKYPLFSALVDSLPEPIAAITVMLNGADAPDLIHQQCRRLLRDLVERQIGRVSYLE